MRAPTAVICCLPHPCWCCWIYGEDAARVQVQTMNGRALGSRAEMLHGRKERRTHSLRRPPRTGRAPPPCAGASDG